MLKDLLGPVTRVHKKKTEKEFLIGRLVTCIAARRLSAPVLPKLDVPVPVMMFTTAPCETCTLFITAPCHPMMFTTALPYIYEHT